MDTSEKNNKPIKESVSHDGASWGPRIFWATLLVLLVFFWWLLIYSHGVETHHG